MPLIDEEDELLGRPPPTKIPYWRDNIRAWQKKTIAGITVPGNCKIGPIGPELNIQEGPASGKDGGKVLIRGMKFRSVVFTTEIDTRADFATFVTKLAPVIFPITQPQAREIVNIYHPMLALWGYNRGLVKHVEGAEPSNGGPMVVKIEVLLVVERENATRSPTIAPAGSVRTVESVDTAGSAKRVKDSRDRARPVRP